MTAEELAAAFEQDWNSGRQHFVVLSSGSTGAPKEIVLERQWMVWSAEKTGSVLNPKKTDILYCCLPLHKVGGLMMLLRSKVWDIPITIAEPASNPLIQKVEADIVSLTPHQMHCILASEESRKNLLRFREVLIGGADIPHALEVQLREIPASIQIRHSYGMSETYSHIALRNVNGPGSAGGFKPLDGIRIRTAQDGTLEIQTPYTNGFLKTNDVADIVSDGSFKIKGRTDFAINSGGIKLFPEQIENLISESLRPEIPFVISALNDEKYGEIPILVTEDKSVFEGRDLTILSVLSPYAIPKKTIEMNPLPLNTGGKADRLLIKKLINN